MTEQEWLTSTDPRAMLEGYFEQCMLNARNASHRKLRLFLCGCVRQVWHLLCDKRSRKAVEVAERFADEEVNEAVRSAAWCAAQSAWEAGDNPAGLARYCCLDNIVHAVQSVTRPDLVNLYPLKGQADLFRCIFGNPYRPVTLPKCERCGGDYTMRWIDNADTGICPNCFRGFSCLTPLVASLATVAYDERPGRACERCGGLGAIDEHRRKNARTIGGYYRVACPDCHGTGRVEDGLLDPARLAVLADVIEEAGCPIEMPCWWCDGRGGSDYDVMNTWDCDYCKKTGCVPHPLLAHLRSPGPHVRGDWSIDLLLGKK